MTTKKLVLILVGVALAAFGVGILSLNRYGFNIYDRQGINISFRGLYTKYGDSMVNIDPEGVYVIDGDEQVKVSFDGIDVRDKKGNSVKIRPGFNIKVEDGNNKLFSEGILGINTKDLIKKDINEIKLEEIKGMEKIDIETPFINVNIIPDKRRDIKIHYNGYIKASYIPELETKKSSNTLYIVTKKDSSNSYSVYNTNLKLDIYVPMDFKENIRITTSSGDITVSELKLRNLDIVSSSGDVEIYNLTGNVDIATSSGEVDLDYEELHNDINISTSSGNVNIVLSSNSNFVLDAHTSSGEIQFNFPIKVTGKLKNSLFGKAGNGRNSLCIATSSGDISINKK